MDGLCENVLDSRMKLCYKKGYANKDKRARGLGNETKTSSCSDLVTLPFMC